MTKLSTEPNGKPYVTYFLLLTMSCLFQAIPKYYYEKLLVLGYPIYTYTTAIVIILAFQVIARQLRARNRALYALVILSIWGVACAVVELYDSQIRFGDFAYDILVIGGLISSIAIGSETRTKTLQRFAIILQLCMLLMLGWAIYSLRVGAITAAVEGQREFDISMFYSAALCTWLLPVVTAALLKARVPVLAIANIVIVSLAELAFAEMSATRNVLIVLALSVTASLVLYCRDSEARWKALSVALLACIIAVPVVFGDIGETLNWIKLENFRYRLGAEQLKSFDRVEEAELLFSQHGLHLVFGLGFGGTFYSNVVTLASPDGLATTLHIGVLTPILKFGLLGLLLLVIIPIVITVKAVFGKFEVTRFGFGAALFTYFVQSLISGGYHYSVTVVIALMFAPLIKSYAPIVRKASSV